MIKHTRTRISWQWKVTQPYIYSYDRINSTFVITFPSKYSYIVQEFFNTNIGSTMTQNPTNNRDGT